MFIKDFNKKSKKIQKILNIENKNTKLITSKFTEYIKDNPDNMELFISSFNNKGAETLIIAPTGSGKTHTINEVFKSINKTNNDIKNEINNSINKEDEKIFKASKEFIKEFFLNKEGDIINLILCPNRIQNLQNEYSYDMKAIIGNKNNLSEYDLGETNNFSTVYDKISELTDVISHYNNTLKKNLKINICIDEAHLLIESLGYRKKSLNKLNEVISKVKENKGSVVYMTATPEPLMIMPFDTIIEFKKDSYTAPADKGTIIKNGTEENFEEVLYFLIKEMISDGKIPFIRYNSINGILRIMTKLTLEDNYTALSVDSSDKGFCTTIDPSSGKELIVYNNLMFNDIINRSSLPGTYKGKKVNAYITTSMVEAGTNIKSIDGVEDKALTPIFVCQDKNNISINANIQFFNRVRYNVGEYVLVMPKKENEYRFRSIEEITKSEKKKLELYIKSFKMGLKSIMMRHSDKKEIINIMKQDFNAILTDGTKNNMNCIYLDEDTMEITYDMNIFWKGIYDKYILQYYYHQDLYAKRLNKELGIEFKEKLIDNIGVVELSNEAEKNVKNILQEVLLNKNLQDEITNNNIRNDKLIKIKHTISFNNVKELMRLGISLIDSIEHVISKDEKGIKKVKLGQIREAIKGLRVSEKNELVEILNNNKNITDINNDITKKAIYNIINSDYAEFIKKASRTNIDMKDFFKVLIESEKIADVKNYIINNKYIENNNRYLKGDHDLLMGRLGIEQKIILNSLYKINKSGNLIQTTLTPELLLDISIKLSRTLHTEYNSKKVLSIIRKCFTLRRKNKVYSILTLKLK